MVRREILELTYFGDVEVEKCKVFVDDVMLGAV